MNQTAQGLAALGRGPDTELVHMAPSEVQGLQQLAMAHGGSLTINPDTGLPEAGFLSSILPMVIGAGLMAATGGAAAPLIAGMSNAATIGIGMGGLTTLATGSLSKGLMAGLGAYGGAGLTGGLMGAGTGALSSAAGSTGAGTAVPVAATEALGTGAAQTAAQAAPDIFGGTASELASAYGYPTVAAPAVPAINVAQAVPTVTQAPVLSQSAADIGNVYAQEQAAQNAVAQKLASTTPMQTMGAGFEAAKAAPGAFLKANAYPLGALGISALGSMQPDALNAPEQDKGMIRPYTYSREKVPSAFQDVAGAPMSSKERRYFTDQYTALTPYKAPGPEYMAVGGPVEAMSNANVIGSDTGYPQSDIRNGAYSNPYQQPVAQNVVTGVQGAGINPYTGQMAFAGGGGVSDLGSYSDGGQLLRGPGDGVSDNIPARIGAKQEARLADGEFVVPARIVSELGNGSTEAGARQLYAMMDRVQKARKKSIGKDKVATNSRAHKLLPA
jgi:hypothetical protein